MLNTIHARIVARAARACAVVEVLEERRLLAAGDLDPTFGGGDGIFISEHPLVPTDMAVQSDGKILVSGWGLGDVGSVIRVNPDGTKDASFGTNGLASSNRGLQNSFANAVAVGPGGRIAVVGSMQGNSPNEPVQATLVLYSAQGEHQPVFGHPFGASDWGPGFNDVAFTPDGKILALGRKMVRFTAEGLVDRTFDGDGIKDFSGKEMIILPDGKILVLGHFALFRFNADGSPDTSFDGDGIVPNVKGSDIALMPDGDILVAGNGPDAKLVTRFNSNGTIDRAFGENGSATVFAGAELAVTPHNIFVGGSLIGIAGPQYQLELTALTHSGRRDLSYKQIGQWTTLVGSISSALINLAIHRGKLLVAAAPVVPFNPSEQAGDIHPGLVRYEARTTPPIDQPPFLGTPFAVPGVIEAEHFDLGGEGIAYHDADGFNLGGITRHFESVDIQPFPPVDGVFPNFYIGFVKAGEWLEYTINVAQAGEHEVTVDASHLRAGGQFHLELGGRRLGPNMTVPQTTDWMRFAPVRQRVTLPAGEHVLRLAFDTEGALGYVGNFDKITFRSAGKGGQTPFKGTPFRPGERIQAEDFDNGGEGVAYHDVEPQNLGGAYRPNEGVDVEPTTDAGGGYNVGFLRPGEWLEYTIDFAESGNYDLLLRFAKLKAGGSFRLTIDSVEVSGDAGQSTGSWQTYANRTIPAIPIPAGRHTVRLQMVTADPTGYVMNVNWLQFNKV